MRTIADALDGLTAEHVTALQWFIIHTGTEQPWIPLFKGVRLVTKAKGIFKPEGSEYAVSVRQVLSGPYPDREPIVRADGTWTYQYYQEGHNPTYRDELYTNRALMACLRDEVPVGVLRQTKGKPGVRYYVLGLALVAQWERGYFFFEGFSPNGLSRGSEP